MISCDDDGDQVAPDNTVTESDTVLNEGRAFKMGFTSWSFGPTQQDVDDTYAFLSEHGDIYVEHIDNNIPWNAWINDSTLPTAFTNEVIGKANKKIAGKDLLISVSILNSNRDELAADLDGSIPEYTSLADDQIEQAYTKHIDYLVGLFNPDYLVIAIEVNELRLRSPEKWEGYTQLMDAVKSSMASNYPDLPISESISLHNLFEPDIADSEVYVDQIVSRVNQMDFASISFYPFLKNQSSKEEMQLTFDFLHDQIKKPIAFVETSQIAENLIIPNLNVSISGSPTSQNDYLELLLENAGEQKYEFIIWWAHRDYDALWETFPVEVKDLGQIWRDTGLLDEDGNERSSFQTWSAAFNQ